MTIYRILTICATLCALLASTSARAEVIISYQGLEGCWSDDYRDISGITSSTNLVVPGGLIQLTPSASAGFFITGLIEPPSFDGWNSLCIDSPATGTPFIELGLLDATGLPVPGYSPLPIDNSGCADLSGLDASLYPSIQVRADFYTNAVPPSLRELKVCFSALTQILIVKTAPEFNGAGNEFRTIINVSASIVDAVDVIVFDPLPSFNNGTVSYPQNVGQMDDPEFISANAGGQLWSGPGNLVTNGVSIPPNSVWWNIANLPAGRSEQLYFVLEAPNGSLHETTYSNQAFVAAANLSGTQTSNWEVTSIFSDPQLSINKTLRPQFVRIGETNYTLPGWVSTFEIRAANGLPIALGESVYDAVIWDDLSPLLIPAPLIDTTLGSGGAINISSGGYFDPAFTPPGATSSIPAVVWDPVVLLSGGAQVFSFSVVFEDIATGSMLSNTGTLFSAQDDSNQVMDVEDYVVGISGEPGLGMSKRANPSSLFPGDETSYTLEIANQAAVDVRDIVIFDRVPNGGQFVAASASPASAGIQIFYSSSAAFPNPTSPPPYTVGTAPGSLGAAWTSTPPASGPTWVAWYIPELTSPFLPVGTGPSSVSLSMRVRYPALTDPCVGETVINIGYGVFHAFVDLDGNLQESATGFDSLESGNSITINPRIGKFNVNSSVTVQPRSLDLDSESIVRVEACFNNNGTGPLTNTTYTVSWDTVNVNGDSSSFPIFSAPISFNYLSNTAFSVTFGIGTLLPGEESCASFDIFFPQGVLDLETYCVSADAIGYDLNCGPQTASEEACGTVFSRPNVRVFKEGLYDFVPAGGTQEYSIAYINEGSSPAVNTYVVDRIPDQMVFLKTCVQNGERVWVSDRDFPDLPAQLSTSDPMDANDIATHFVPATLDPISGCYTSPFGEATTFVAWEVDDLSLTPPLLVADQLKSLTVCMRNDEDRGPAQQDSANGTLIRNRAGIFADGLIQALTAPYDTLASSQPGIQIIKSGPSVAKAGEQIEWVIDYRNNSGSADTVLELTEHLPAGLVFISAEHRFNDVAISNGASSSVTAETSSSTRADGGLDLFFDITGDQRGGDILPAEGGSITVRVEIPANTPTGSTFINVACGTAQNQEGSFSICDEAEVQVFNPDLTIQKIAFPADPRAGDIVTYRVFIGNIGQVSAPDVTITDTLPADLSYLPGSTQITPATDWMIGEPVVSGNQIQWSITDGNALASTMAGIPAGEVPAQTVGIQLSYQAVVGFNVPSGSNLVNTVCIQTPCTEDDLENNCASALVVTPFADLDIQKVAPVRALPGQEITYTISYINRNNETAANGFVIDTLPDLDGDGAVDVRFVSANPTGPGAISTWYHCGPTAPVPAFNPTNASANIAAGWSATQPACAISHVAFSVGDIPASSPPYVIQLAVQLTNPTTGADLFAGEVFSNCVAVGTSSIETNVANNTDCAVTALPGIDMAISKVGSVEGALTGIAPGSALTYTLEFCNRGTVPAYGIELTDSLDAVLEFAMPESNATILDLFDAAGGTVYPFDLAGNIIGGSIPISMVAGAGSQRTWVLGSLAASDPFYFRNVGIPPGACGQLEVYVVVSDAALDTTRACNTVVLNVENQPGNTIPEDDLDNNQDESCVTIYRPDVEVSKKGVDLISGQSSFTDPGNQIEYTISYDNIGNFAASNVVIRDIFPEGTKYISGPTPLPSGASLSLIGGSTPNGLELTFDVLEAPTTYWNQNQLVDQIDNIYEGLNAANELSGLYTRNISPLRGYNSDVEVVDINQDGCLDVLFAEYYVEGIFDSNYDGYGASNIVALGDCNGGFIWTNMFNVGRENSSDFEILDVDCDGIDDVVLLNQNAFLFTVPTNNTVFYPNRVFFGLGGGSFGPGVEMFNAYGTNTSYDIEFADFDMDGDLDAVVATEVSDILYLNQCGGVFTPSTNEFNTFGAQISRQLAVGDLNQDGNQDVMIGSSGSFALYYGNGNGTFQVAVTNFGPTNATLTGEIHFMDFEGDGDLDILTSVNVQPFSQTYINDGAGNFTISTNILVGGTTFFAEYSTSGDVNGDGLDDIIHRHVVYLNNGNGMYEFSAPLTSIINDSVEADTEIVDFNGDGRPDFAIGIRSSNTGGDAPFTIPGKPIIQLSQPVSTDAFCIAPADENLGSTRTVRETTTNIEFMVTDDWNADGFPDIAYLTESGELFSYLGTGLSNDAGTGTLRYADTEVTTLIGNLSATDVTGDGIPDLISRASTTNGLEFDVFVGVGDGTFSAANPSIIPTIPGGYNVLSGLSDFNGDGISDVYAFTPGTNVVLLGDGAGGFSAPVFSSFPYPGLSAATGKSFIEFADFDQDGNQDVIMIDPVFAWSTAIFWGLGNGAFDPPLRMGSGGNMALDLTVVDIDGNGQPGFIRINDRQGTSQGSDCYDNIAALRGLLTTEFEIPDNGFGKFVKFIDGGGVFYPASPDRALTGNFNCDPGQDVLLNYGSGGHLYSLPNLSSTADEFRVRNDDAIVLDLNQDGLDDVIYFDRALYVSLNQTYSPVSVLSPVITPTTIYPGSGALESWDELVVEETSEGGNYFVYDVLDAAGMPIPGFTNLIAGSDSRIDLTGLSASAIRLRATSILNEPCGAIEFCGWQVNFSMEESPSFSYILEVCDPLDPDICFLTNQVQAVGDIEEITLANNVDETSIELRAADIAIDKFVDNGAATEGETLVYTLDYENLGPFAALAPVVTDILPLGISGYVATPSPSSVSGTGVLGNPTVLSWTLPPLANGQSGSITVEVTVALGTAGSLLQNEASIDDRRADKNLANNQSKVETFIGSAANVTIEKSVDQPFPVIGGGVVYTLDYSNNGNTDAENVIVEDLMPAGLSFISASPVESLASNLSSGVTSVRWNLGTVAAGSGGQILVTALVDADPLLQGVSLVNTACVQTTTAETDSSFADNCDTETVTPRPVQTELSGKVGLDLNRDGSLLADPPLAGILVILSGTDFLGNPVSITNATDEAGQFTFSDLQPGTYSLTEIQPLGYGSSSAATGLVYTVDGGSTPMGTVLNPNTVSNITLGPGDLAVGFCFADTIGSIGDFVWCDSNGNGLPEAGEPALSNVVVVISGTDASGQSVVRTTITDAQGFYEATRLLAGSYTVTADLSAFPNAELSTGTNPVLVDLPAGICDLSIDFGIAKPFIVIEKEDMPDPLLAGAPLTYTLWIGNPSPVTARNVIVTEQYPAAFVFTGAEPQPSSNNNEWSIGDLEPGEVRKISIYGSVAASASPGSFTNCASAASDNAPLVTSKEPTTVIPPTPEGETVIRITKRDTQDPVPAGGIFSYIIRVENEGNAPATNLVVQEVYDAGFEFAGADPTPSSGDATWQFPLLDAGDYIDIVISGMASTNLSDGEWLLNCASVTAENAPPSKDEEITKIGTSTAPSISKVDHLDPVSPGDVLIYTITVENTAGEAVSNVQVTEDYSPWFTFSSAQPAPISGTENQWHIDSLAGNSVWTLVITGTVSTATPVGHHIFNTAEVTVDCGSQTAHEETRIQSIRVAGIDLEKATNGQDADTPDGPSITVGDQVTWTYVVRNTGNQPLSNVTVTDSDFGAVSGPDSGDTNGDGILQTNEVWTFTATGIASFALYRNDSTVNALSSTGDPVTDEDPSHYTGVYSGAPGIDIEKATNGQDADTPDGPSITVGDQVTWTYVVRNIGSQPLSNVTVTDSDFGAVSGPDSGDTNNDGILQTNEVWTFTATGIASFGLYRNDSTANALSSTGDPVTDEDPSHYTGELPGTPGLAIEKSTNGIDSDEAPGEDIVEGTPVTWTYAVQNTGSLPLSNVSLNDSDLGTISGPLSGDTNQDGLLQPSETWIYEAEGTATVGPYMNLGTVTATPTMPDGSPITGAPSVEAEDPSHYTGIQLVRIGDRIWYDTNRDGIQDAGETDGVDGVTVQLLDASGQVSATTVTSNNGSYAFLALPGSYRVKFDFSTLPMNVTLSPANVGAETSDSDGDPVTGETRSTGNLLGGAEDLDLDLGVYLTAWICSFVWDDLANDQNPIGDNLAELGIVNVRVHLYDVAADGSRTLIDTVLTDDNGQFLFIGLLPGTYAVDVERDDIPTELVGETTPMTYNFTVTAGEKVESVHFGFNNIPTAIELLRLEVIASPAGNRVEWDTASEVNTLGFTIRYATSPEGPFETISELILAENSSSGASYHFVDRVSREATGYYLLEEIELDLSTSQYGPVTLAVGIPLASSYIDQAGIYALNLGEMEDIGIFLNQVELPTIHDAESLWFYLPSPGELDIRSDIISPARMETQLSPTKVGSPTRIIIAENGLAQTDSPLAENIFVREFDRIPLVLDVQQPYAPRRLIGQVIPEGTKVAVYFFSASGQDLRIGEP